MAFVFLLAAYPATPEVPDGTPLPTFRLLAATDQADAVTGASVTEDPATPDGTAPSADSPPAAAAPDATSGATPGGGTAPQPSILGKDVSLQSHRVTGYVAGGLLAAAGAIGLWRFLDLREGGHEYREDDDAVSGASVTASGRSCDEIIHDEWANDQTLRWIHVGLLSVGESLYLYDAVTGISMMAKGASPTLAGKIHRNAFFVHAGLMAADVITGFLLTSALERGNHDQVVGFGAAHAAIGITIPVIILGSGLAADFLDR